MNAIMMATLSLYFNSVLELFLKELSLSLSEILMSLFSVQQNSNSEINLLKENNYLYEQYLSSFKHFFTISKPFPENR